MKERIRLLSAVLCAGQVILSAFTAAAGPCCFVEVGVDHILKDGTTGMSSNDRLKWYLEQTGRPVDEAVARAQDEISENCVAILNAGGEIREYVTQTTDNDFYLTHNAGGAPDVNGSAFFDSRCEFFPADDQVIIHGHNMKGGAVFGRLNNYRDVGYLCRHPLITLETLAGTDYYVPYAVTDINVDMSAPNYFLAIVWKFDPDSFRQYTGYLKEKSYYRIPVDVEFGDRLLTLSTCSYVYSDSRLVVCARKMRDWETPEYLEDLVSRSTLSGVSPDAIAPYAGGGDYERLTPQDMSGLNYETEEEIPYIQEAAADLFDE